MQQLFLFNMTCDIILISGVKDMYVNVMSNSKPTENILAPDSIFQASQLPTTIYNPSM